MRKFIEKNSKMQNFATPVYIGIDFSNGGKFINAVDPRVPADCGLAGRLADTALSEFNWIRATHDDVAELDLVDIFTRIVEGALVGHADDAVVPIIIHFDEYGMYDAAMKKSRCGVDHPFRALFLAIRRVMYYSSALGDHRLRRLHESGRYFVVPVATGLSFGDVAFDPNQSTLVKIPISTLSVRDSVHLANVTLRKRMNDMALSEAEIDRLFQSSSFMSALGDAGGVPGWIESLCASVNSGLNDGSFGQLLDAVVSGYMSAFKKPRFWDDVVALMFTSTTVNRKMALEIGKDGSQMTIGDLVDRGCIHCEPCNDESGKPSESDFVMRIAPAFLRVSKWSDGMLSIPGLLPLVSDAMPWTWQHFERFHCYFIAATLASFKRLNAHGETVPLRRVLRGAQPKNSTELDTRVCFGDFSANKIEEDELQCFTPTSAQTGKDNVILTDSATVHLAQKNTISADSYFNIQDVNGTWWTIFFRYKHSDADGKKTTVKLSEMNEWRRNINDVISKSAQLEQEEDRNRWVGRRTLLVVVTNRIVEIDEALHPGVVWISRKEIEEHLHVFAHRGLLPAANAC